MEKLVPIIIPVTFVLALVAERLFPARELPKVRFWVLKGFGFFALSGAIHTSIPAVIAATVGRHAPVSIAALGTLPSAFLAFAIADLPAYFLHRVVHRSSLLWRWSHQLHHSVERLDAAAFPFSHPLDGVLFTITAGVPVALLGLTPNAGAVTGLIGFGTALFQHMNIRTPEWLGYVIQRPEAHAVHHARGVHAYNYATFSLWDILFGTFRNPRTFTGQTGFWDGASSKLGAMLVGRDVSHPGLERSSIG